MNWREAEREYEDEVVGDTNLARMFEDAAARHENRPAQMYKGGIYERSLTGTALPAAPAGDYHAITYAEMHQIVRYLAAGFRDLGLETGDRVGMFAHTRMEWAQADFAALAAGGVVTTVYPGSSERQVEHLLGDPGASFVVVQNAELLERVLAVEDALDIDEIVVMDEYEGHEGRDDVRSLAALYERGREVFDRETYESWVDERDLSELASLIYTSGTTGKPKGVMLTHENFRSNVNQIRKRFGPRPDKEGLPSVTPETTVVSYLPLAHVFERTGGHFLMFASGATVAYAESPDTLREDFQLVGPTSATSVPRVYEKIYDAIREQATESGVKERIFNWAVSVGRQAHETDDPGPVLRAKHRLADRLVFQQVREGLGGNVEFLISGGGSLSPELAKLYHAMDLPILEGYGLTETSPVITTNPIEEPKVGTIGAPVVDTDLRIDESVAEDLEPAEGGEVGELLVDGPQVFDGYWELPAVSEDAFTEDGYFRTGDVVERRPDGFLTFRDRSKELLVLSTGKNVAPQPIESAFASNRWVTQAMAVGDSQKFVAALIVPNFDTLREWADEEGFDLPEDEAEICNHDRVRELIEREIAAANEEFESHETIKKFRLVPEEWTEDNGLLTPTMKKKRRNILAEYDDLVEEMYQQA